MKNINKSLSLVLVFVLMLSVFPFNTVYAVTGNTENIQTQQEATKQTEEFVLPDIVEEAEAAERGYIGRSKTEEKDNYTFVFKNSDNTRTMRVYSHPVKYTDKDGNIKDITLDIQARNGGGFETKDNNVKTTFGAKLSDGIRLQHESVDIKLIPANKNIASVLSEDNKTVSYTLDTKTSLEYSLTYMGFKEDIVVKEYTGQTEYEFLLYTNGLTVKEEMGSYYLADDQGNRKANIGDIIIFTADERNNTLGSLSCKAIKENQIYRLTIHIDAEYLKDEKTVYPIRIDPTFEITSATTEGAIEDVTVQTNATYSGTLGILYLGTSNNRKYRVLMKFPNVDIPVVFPEMIVSASVEFRDVMCQSVPVAMECRYYNGSENAWSESGTTTWSSIGGDLYVGSLIDTKNIYYGNGNEGSDINRYSFDITDAAKDWADGTRSPKQGLIFKAADESFSSTEDRLKYFGSYNRSDYRTSFSLQYRDYAVYTISKNNKFLTASEFGLSNIDMVTSSSPDYDGNTMWCIQYLHSHDAYQIVSMGIKAYYGTRQATIFSNSAGVGVGDEFMYATQTCFFATCTDKGKYIFKAKDTGNYLCVSTSNVLEQTSTQSSATVFNFNSIETESFNNFWSGGYSRGIYNGVAHIKIVLDSSITNSDFYEDIDFSSAKLWNGITERVVIYGPEDEPPVGITPFVITYRAESLPLLVYEVYPEIYEFSFIAGVTIPNGLSFGEVSTLSEAAQLQLFSSDWNSVTIIINNDEENWVNFYGSEAVQASVEKTIVHEMGHALKLAHLNDDLLFHAFSNGRECYSTQTEVYSLMNQGAPKGPYAAPLTAAVPQAHDIISLISKWEYHVDCDH